MLSVFHRGRGAGPPWQLSPCTRYENDNKYLPYSHTFPSQYFLLPLKNPSPIFSQPIFIFLLRYLSFVTLICYAKYIKQNIRSNRMFKYYYYEVAVTTRPNGTMQPVVGIITQLCFTSPENALKRVLKLIKTEYEVNYGFFIRQFRRIK